MSRNRRHRVHRQGAAGAVPRTGEIYFEHHVVGNTVKVSAIDADTGVEVSIFGPLKATQQQLETVALNKLRYVMKSRN